MSVAEIMHEIDILPSPDRWQVLAYARHSLEEGASEFPRQRKTPVFGCARGQFHAAADFDAPLNDFKDYQ